MQGSPELNDWIITPAIAATMRSKHKQVRAIGEIATYTVMLPWALTAVTIGMFAILVLMGFRAVECICENISDWWADV